MNLDDVKRMKLGAGEALLVTVPSGSTANDARVAMDAILQLREVHGLDWPVIISANGTIVSVVDGFAYTAPVHRSRCCCCRHHHHDARSISVSIVLSDKDQLPLSAAALEGDALTPDPNAAITWESDAPDVVAITDNGDGTALAVSGTDGVANVTAVATDPDGNEVRSEPLAITVVNGSTDAASVAITPGTPEPKPAA